MLKKIVRWTDEPLLNEKVKINTLTRAHIPVHAHRQRNKYTERTTDTHIMCTHFNDDICVVAQEKTHMTKTNTQI